VNE
ncbi:DNA polymerase III, subunit gamma and tau, partial [Vibrio parahaemolyticus 3256]|jgi:hypothetical protein